MLLAIVLGAGAWVVSATPAGASSGTGKIIQSPCTEMRTAPTTAGSKLVCIPKGKTITIDCTLSGGSVTGPYGATKLWDHTSYSGKKGFVSDAWVYTGKSAAVAGNCGTPFIMQSPCTALRSSPSTSASDLVCVPQATRITIDCTKSGSSVSGPYGATTLWDHTTYAGKKGYVSDAWTYTGTAAAVTGTCGQRLTVAQFVSAYNGKTVANAQGTYPGQCVSLVSQYLLHVYGITTGSWGNAVDYKSGGTGGAHMKANGFSWSTSTSFKNGDILVWGKGTYTSSLGHVAIYYNGKIFEQNPGAAHLGSFFSSGYLGRWRK